MSRDDWIEPPLSLWSIVIEDEYDRAEELAQAEGREFKGEFYLHEAHKRPDIWEKLLDVRAALRNENDPRRTTVHEWAADRLEAMLRDKHRMDHRLIDLIPTSEFLVEMVERWFEQGVYRDRRKELGVPVTQTVATILRDVRKSLNFPADDEEQRQLDALVLCAHEIQQRPGAPMPRDVETAAYDALEANRRLRAIIDQVEAAAPAARGRQLDQETRARLRLAEDLWRAQGCGERDREFWVLLGAIWERLEGEETLPGRATIADHLNRVAGSLASEPPDIETKTLDWRFYP